MIMTDADQLREALRLAGEELDKLRQYQKKHPCPTWKEETKSCDCRPISKSEQRRLAVQQG